MGPLGEYRSRKCVTILKNLISSMHANIIVLEIGAGKGQEASNLMSSRISYVALEIEATKCTRMNEDFKTARSNQKNFVIQASGEALPLRTCSFDFVFCRAVLHHVSRPFEMIVEMQRVTKNEGLIALIDEPNVLNPLLYIVRFLVKRLALRAYFLMPYEFYDPKTNKANKITWFNLRQLMIWLKRLGFKPIKGKTIWLPYITHNKMFFKLWLLFEKPLETTFLTRIFGQLFVVARK